jgi:hypothetical protein
MDLLHIGSLRPGADQRNPQGPNGVNFDESKANPYPNLPDPLTLNNGKKVKTAKAWWRRRRPEIVELFDREVYGRVPKTLLANEVDLCRPKASECRRRAPPRRRTSSGHSARPCESLDPG